MNNRKPSDLENMLYNEKELLLPIVSVSDLGNLSQSCRWMNQFFKEDLSSIRLKQLVYYLAQAPNPNKVKTIIESDRNLLKVVFKEVQLRSRTVINVTPLQFAYGARHGEMCEILKPEFTVLCGTEEAGRKEIEKQINEKFQVEEKFKFDFRPIIQAILNESFTLGRDAAQNLILSPATLEAIKKFREDFAESQAKFIDKGTHFPLEILVALLKIYAEVLNQWGGDYFYAQGALLEDVVIACVLGYVSENDAQKFSQGLFYLQAPYNPEPLKHSLITRDGHNFYDALKKPSNSFHNLDSSHVNIIDGFCGNSCPNAVSLLRMAEDVEKLISNKNLKLGELMQQHSQSRSLHV